MKCPENKPIIFAKSDNNQLFSYKKSSSSIVETMIPISNCKTVQETNTDVVGLKNHPV